MSNDSTLKSRALFIGICIILMVVIIFLIGKSIGQETSEELTKTTFVANQSIASNITQEAKVFYLTDQAFRISTQPSGAGGVRTLSQFYQRRQYPGAPPVIPHSIIPVMKDEALSCLTCHEKGGYVTKFKAYAPLTPHPEMLSCQQCHVAESTSPLFQESDWESVTPPLLGRTGIPGGPPPIPHSLQMRESCLSCHGGAAAIKEIKSGHPERINCRQCHVTQQEEFFQTKTLSSPLGAKNE